MISLFLINLPQKRKCKIVGKASDPRRSLKWLFFRPLRALLVSVTDSVKKVIMW